MIALSSFKTGVLIGCILGAIAGVFLLTVAEMVADELARIRSRRRHPAAFQLRPWINGDSQDADILDFPPRTF